MGDGVSPLPEQGCSLIITSLGRADLGAIPGLARDLRLDCAWLERAVLQAPSVLFRELAPFTARRWRKRLEQAGLVAAIAAPEEPAKPPVLRDAAICPRNAAGQRRLVGDLVQFLGIERGTVTNRLGRDPGWVLRRISDASVAALRRRFDGGDVSVRVSNPQATAHDLDTRAMSRPARAALDRALGMIGARASGTLPSYLAQSLWGSFGPRGLRLVDRAFRNHVVRLVAPPRSDQAHAAALALSGHRDLDRALDRASLAGPVNLDQGLDWFEAPEAAAAYRAMGLRVDVVAEPLGALRRDPKTTVRDGQSDSAIALERLLKQFDKGTQPVGQGSRAGIDNADFHGLAAPVRQQPDQATSGQVIAYDIFRKKR